MEERPAIGRRVRVLAITGMKDTTGQHATVVAHFPDGIAFRVRLDGGKKIVCDPECVEELANA